MEPKELHTVWKKLSVDKRQGQRSFRTVVDGIRQSWNKLEDSIELLVNVENEWKQSEFPKWSGMNFSSIQMNSPNPTPTLILELLDDELSDVFFIFCSDIIESTKGMNVAMRTKELKKVIENWDAFFRGPRKKLSENSQSGLYAELWWLRRLLQSSIDVGRVIKSWKGPSRAFHDFEFPGAVVEVKSTKKKEPRQVTINNERQLDDEGLDNLHLFVLTLNIHEKGESLPKIVDEIYKLTSVRSEKNKFRNKLGLARYFDTDCKEYTSMYTIRHQELFKVEKGFPRITRLPKGLGNLSYGVLISSCKKYEVEIEQYLTLVRRIG